MTAGSTHQGYWADFPDSYRAEQVETIARWIAVAECGVVIGGSGTGKSNLAGYISERNDVMARALPRQSATLCFLHLDVNRLPSVTTAHFYRAMLYTLCMTACELVPERDDEFMTLLTKASQGEDTLALYFSLQRAHSLLIQRSGKAVVWLMDRFDEACKQLEAGTLSGLRSLRDQFKGKLTYIVFTRLPLARLRNPQAYDEFHEIMVRNTCWVGPMVQRDGEWVARQMAERYQTCFATTDVSRLLALTGRLPAFLKAACAALAEGQLTANASEQEWVEQLSAQPIFQRNCQEIWNDCSAAEQQFLTLLVNGADTTSLNPEAVGLLTAMGIVSSADVNQRPMIFSPIFAGFVQQQSKLPAATLTIDERTGNVLRNGLALPDEFTQLEMRLLAYFIKHTDQLCEKDALIRTVWPDEKLAEGVRDDSLAQLIKRLRDKVEIAGSTHSYIQTIRGRGYRFVQPAIA